jgi:anti-sigma B factor antagonist
MAEPWSPDEVPVPGQLVIESATEAEVTTLTLAGELDLASTPTLERELASVESSGAKKIVIDLAGVGFMDSTGLQALLRARERARTETGIQLALKRGPHQVQRVFELTKTADAFTFID